MSLSPERAARLEKIVQEIGEHMKEIGPKLIRVSHLRKEARSILEEAGEIRSGSVT